MWVEYLRKEHTKLNLSEISAFASTKWKHESSKVKEFYKRLSAEATSKLKAINKSRVFIYHNQCNNTQNENVLTLQSSTTNNSEPETAAEISPAQIPFQVASFDSPALQNQQIQQIQQIQQQQQLNQPQFNPNFTYDLYSSFDTSHVSPIFDTFNSLTEMINNFNLRTFNLTNPQELEKFLANLKSIINECKLLAHFCAIREKLKELEIVTSGPFNGAKDNSHYGIDLTRGFQGIQEIPQDYPFNYVPENYVDGLITSLGSPSSIVYPNYLADNTTFSQFNNYYLLERNKDLELRFCRIQELLKAMSGLIFGIGN
ncbi:hypothetical protein RclHR1_00070012 [Rhizophagus clarus]|nr:hypothetical protein RclHR1_00070012 [Rhizophagus clarus]